jgi:outer membrane protein OmpA-like peptidoglycan-associated protein
MKSTKMLCRISTICFVACIWLDFNGPVQAQTSLSSQRAFHAIDVFFCHDSALLDSVAKKSLTQIDTVMLRRIDVHFVLNGHADPVGPDAYNLRLSEKRVREVVRYLNKVGVDETRIVWNARGETQSKQAMPVDYALWRKVEITPIIMKQ